MLRRAVPVLLLPVLLLNLCMFGELLQGVVPASAPAPAADAARVPRIVVLVFDGVDHSVLEGYRAAGLVPNLDQLARDGGFVPLLSELPPESPVALAAMQCGVGPGRTLIFDFVQRGPRNRPVNGMTDLVRARFAGRFPLRAPRVTSRLAFPTFTDRVWEAGYSVLSLRQPLLFPAPDRPGARMTAGLGTPDIAGSAGFYTIYSSRLRTEEGYTVFGGYRMALEGGADTTVFDTVLFGPQDPTLGPDARGGNQRASVPLRFERETFEGVAGVRITLDGASQFVPAGERSGFFDVGFALNTLPVARALRGTVRFEVRGLEPLEVMADPVQQDPRAPLLPLSSPAGLGAELWERDGPYESMGWQEQTFALNDRVQDDAGFLRDLLQDMDRGEVTLLREMARVREQHDVTPRLVYYTFTATDRASHGYWRHRDVGHPAHDPNDPMVAMDPIGIVYQRMDLVVGAVRATLAPEDTLLICSDHGFQTWRWGVHVNQWLADEGYLTLTQDAETKGLGPFFTFGEGPDAIDWSKTRAFALGLGQIYINLRGRDETGIVKPEDKRALMEEIRGKLLKLENPYHRPEDVRDGIPRNAVRSVTLLEDVYTYGPGGPPAHAPDLQIGFEVGYRISWQTALLGGMARHGAVFERNLMAWSGDHCSTDRELVPGVLLCNRPVLPAPDGQPYTVRDICATVMAHFGLDLAPLHGESKPVRLGPAR
ncbi:MAG: alkaline phosphatase family protein [Planctomycetota bacterium]|nr:alkaline phosphatase family protein [Planctomycetota bacterium]